ncbi:hydroxyisourate hydrolase [Acetobacter conturbans]|uniref:5-hydroxyisourate hydrolase n=1 Tax=Acetobacter conturbans TaxID=1737472 RepID=A0ABX0JY85_9PROT|nr:hydroxyisourate hydrolase [Acetobacter conturbans]NHN87415.1 hydroxyisourate hydrolase [Acetobacter conturbans]
MSTLSTHVLDQVSGLPAAGMSVTLWRGDTVLFAGMTNEDGRCPDMKDVGELEPGNYRLEFAVAPYFRRHGVELSNPPFLDTVPIAFGIAEPQAGKTRSHYHVPLLASPFGYATYRGS